MSHNIYYDDSEITSTCFCKYLILIENEYRTEIIPCTCLTSAIEIAKTEKSLCRIFERRGSMGKQWTYLCDVLKNYILWKRKSELDKAYEYEKSLQKNGIIKDFKLYNKMLDEYAAIRGFWNWEDMLQAFINDEG